MTIITIDDDGDDDDNDDNNNDIGSIRIETGMG